MPRGDRNQEQENWSPAGSLALGRGCGLGEKLGTRTPGQCWSESAWRRGRLEGRRETADIPGGKQILAKGLVMEQSSLKLNRE